MLVVIVHSFLVFILLLFFILLLLFFVSLLFMRCCSSFIAFQRHSSPFCGLSPGFTPILYFQPSPMQSDSWYFHFQPFRDLLFTVLPRALQFWVGIFYPQAFFFTFRSFTDILPAFIKVSLGASSSSLKFGGLHTDPRNRTSPSVCLIHSNTRSSYSEPFIFKFYQTLSWITCGKKFSLYAPYLFWTLFACSKSYVKTIKKHLWTRVVTAYNYFDECYFKKAVRHYIKDSMSNGYKMFLKLKYLFNSK